MHVLSGIVFSGTPFEDRVERVAYLSSLSRRDHTSILQRLAVSDAGSDIGFEQTAVEAIRVIEVGEARIDPAFESSAPKFLRHTRLLKSCNSRLSPQKSGVELGSGQYHLAVAGGCAAFRPVVMGSVAARLRTHPLPRGGT